MSTEQSLLDWAGVGARQLAQTPPWLASRRAEALASFASSGLPTRRDEDWKYTSVAAIERGRFSFEPAATDQVTVTRIEALALPGAHRLVFIDGRHAPEWSSPAALPAGVRVDSLRHVLALEPARLQAWLGLPPQAEADAPGSGFAALNLAWWADGAYIHLEPGIRLAMPIQLLFVARSGKLATHSRNLVIAAAGSSACIVEHHASLDAAGYFTNVVTDIRLAGDARIEHHKLQEESQDAFHIAAVHAELAQGSEFISGSFALGGALARTDISVCLNGERATCSLDGLYLVDGRQHVDHHTRIDHAQPRGTSREFYKGVLAGAARGVFNGKVIVHPDAQLSDAEQRNHNLLLSAQAEIDTKPQLEIWADDVKCSHGATVGQLDAEQIFYLCARGIDAVAAHAMLTYAFAAEMIERVPLAPLQARLQSLLRQRLPQAMELLP